MRASRMDDKLVADLHRRAKAVRWNLSLECFGEALEASLARGVEEPPAGRDAKRYLTSLHLEDLALAWACAEGDEAAWEYFIREHRPVLYRAAEAIDPTGNSRELADSLYADLYGVQDRQAGNLRRRSLFRYFHGRSSLATWLRAVLAQRHVDRVRAERRTVPLPDNDSTQLPSTWHHSDPDRDRGLTAMREALLEAMSRLAPREKLRLGCYYAQALTLAETGRLLGEHEATVSRQLARTRRIIREHVEAHLRGAGFADAEVQRFFECVVEDSGSLDLREMLHVGAECKETDSDRS